jgi:hypothetical protein
MAEVLETEDARQWRAKVTTFNFDVDAVGGTMRGCCGGRWNWSRSDWH